MQLYSVQVIGTSFLYKFLSMCHRNKARILFGGRSKEQIGGGATDYVTMTR